LEQLGSSGNLATASAAYEKASSEFAEIRSFFKSHLQNGQHEVPAQTLTQAF
jgi:hypothetical protein